MTASTASARIDALVRPPEASSPRPSSSTAPSSSSSADLGQHPGVDHGGADLGQRRLRAGRGRRGSSARPPPGRGRRRPGTRAARWTARRPARRTRCGGPERLVQRASGSANVGARAARPASPRPRRSAPSTASAGQPASELGDDVVDGVADGAEVLEVLVLDAEARPSARRAPPRAPPPARSGPASRRRGPRRTRRPR